MNIAYEPSELENYETYYTNRRHLAFKEQKVNYRNPEKFDALMKQMHLDLPAAAQSLFDILMKMEWLDRNFEYDGKVVKELGRYHGTLFDFGVAAFWRKNYSYTPAYWRFGYNNIIRAYADDLFPGFADLDPLEGFKYPFEFMNLECLLYVHKMEGRMQLLHMGEKHKMNYGGFRDYVLAAQSRFYAETGRRHRPHFRMQGGSAPYLAEIPTIEEEIKRKRL